MNETEKPPCPLCGTVKAVSDWMARPFNPQGSAFQWVLFLGLIIVGVGLWQFILLELNEDTAA